MALGKEMLVVPSTTFVKIEIARQILDGLPWLNFIQTFIVPGGWILQTRRNSSATIRLPFWILTTFHLDCCEIPDLINPLNFHLVPLAGQTLHLSSEISQQVLHGLLQVGYNQGEHSGRPLAVMAHLLQVFCHLKSEAPDSATCLSSCLQMAAGI